MTYNPHQQPDQPGYAYYPSHTHNQPTTYDRPADSYYAPAEPAPPSDPEPVEPEKKNDAPAWVGVLVILGVIAVCGVIGYAVLGGGDGEGADAAPANDTPPLAAAVETCAPDEPGIRVGDGGRSVSIDGAGLADGPDVIQVACVLGMVDVPDSVVSRIDNTRALDGTQTGEWDSYSASWTYHPDNGLNMVIEQS